MNNFIIFNISKHEILTKDISQIQNALKNILERQPLDYFASTHIIFGGYDNDNREIFEIQEIREWALFLLKSHPEILFYTNKELSGFQNLLLCVSKVKKEFVLRDRMALHVELPEDIHSFLHESIRTSNKPKQLTYIVCNELDKFQAS